MLRALRPRALLAALCSLPLSSACQHVPTTADQEPQEESSGGSSGNVLDDGGEDDGGGGNGPVFNCEPGNETSCPPGQKCTALATTGPQNHFECVADDGELLPDDECTPAPGTGQDHCTTGHVCLVSKPEDTLGRCLQACRNDADCEPDKCTQSPFTSTTFCAKSCDPLVPSCTQGLVCRQADDRFLCGMAIDVDTGLTGDNCDGTTLRGCAENFACLAGALVPGCNSGNCCTNTCDLAGGSDQCVAPSLCRALFPSPAPGFENVGACFIPLGE